MKTLLILGMLLVSTQNFASDKGNGGSGNEALLIAQQSQLEAVSLKIRTFFLKNEASLKSDFPEFEIQSLVKKIKNSDIRVVDADKLIDKDGVSRTCLNYPDSSLIECKSSEIALLLDQPSTLFVLIFHEYLGLIGVEETSANNANVIAGYSISRRIAPYVSKVSDYDLVFKTECAEMVKAKKIALYIVNHHANLFNTTGKKIVFTEKEIFGDSVFKTREEFFNVIYSGIKFKKVVQSFSSNGINGTSPRGMFLNILKYDLQINLKKDAFASCTAIR